MTKTDNPSTDYLKEIVLDSNRDLPLHAQLRKALERLITERFEDQNRFYSESQLVGSLGVSQGTIRRVLADLAAQGLLEKHQARCTIVRKRSAEKGLRNLAVFLPDFTSPNVARMLSLLNAECLNRGIRMQPIYTHRGERLLKAYNNLNFAAPEGGVVLLENSPRATVELANALSDVGYRCVIVGTVLKGSPYRCVATRNDSLMAVGLRHLVDLGHRRITLLVNEPEEKESVQERIAAFDAWVAASEIKLHSHTVHSGIHVWEDSAEAAAKAMDEAMSAAVQPTAIFAISDVGAINAIKWLHKHGLRVPEDVSVIGIGGAEMGAMLHPTLTTLVGPGEEAVRAVFHLLTDQKDDVRQILLEPSLLVRESTARPST